MENTKQALKEGWPLFGGRGDKLYYLSASEIWPDREVIFCWSGIIRGVATLGGGKSSSVLLSSCI